MKLKIPNKLNKVQTILVSTWVSPLWTTIGCDVSVEQSDTAEHFLCNCSALPTDRITCGCIVTSLARKDSDKLQMMASVQVLLQLIVENKKINKTPSQSICNTEEKITYFCSVLRRGMTFRARLYYYFNK